MEFGYYFQFINIFGVKVLRLELACLNRRHTMCCGSFQLAKLLTKATDTNVNIFYQAGVYANVEA